MALALWLEAPAAADPLTEAIARGDAAYARRAEGASGPLAKPGPIQEALASYRGALALDADSVEARYKLLRALFFRASFCGLPEAERRRLFDRARAVAEEGIGRLDKRAGLAKGPARLEALRRMPGAAQLCFWAAASWGEWALAHGTLAAAGQGAAARVRDLAQTVIDLDPQLEEGGGHRILGRLQDQSPRIPLITGWVSREQALVHLRKALTLAPHNTVNQFFLAEAILSHDPARKQEARRLLVRCAGVTEGVQCGGRSLCRSGPKASRGAPLEGRVTGDRKEQAIKMHTPSLERASGDPRRRALRGLPAA